MSEGISAGAEGGKAPEAGGMPASPVAGPKKFFMLEYLDEARKGLGWLRTSPKPEQGIVPKVTEGLRKWAKLRKARVGVIAIMAIMLTSYGLFSAQAGSTKVLQGPGAHGPGPTGHNQSLTFSGTVAENGKSPQNMTLNVTKFASLTMTLTWRDEGAPPLRTNQPDQLGFSVKAPDGENWTAPMASNPPGGQGQVVWKLNDTSKDYGAGAWMVTVEGGTMGDIVKTSGNPICVAGCSSDTSNAWSLSVEAAW